jgi:hypothetical protein
MLTADEVLTAARNAYGERSATLTHGADGLLTVERGSYSQVIDTNQCGTVSVLQDALRFCVLAFDREAPPV